MVSRLSDVYEDLFTHVGERKDKHVRAHEVYAVNVAPEALPELVEATWGGEWGASVGLPTMADREDEARADIPAQFFNAGSHIVVSGYSQLSVLAALEDLAKSGSQVRSPISKIGKKWIATCDHPPTAADDCKVEELGYMRIVTGPTREGVSEKVQELLHGGARLVHDLDQASGVWTAVCEISS